MTPEQISLVGTLVGLVDKVNGWQLSTILFMVLVVPWLCLIAAVYMLNKRFEEMAEMYENNAVLVEKNEELTVDYKEQNKEQKDIIMMNTQAITRLTEAIEKNQFCTALRLDKQARGIPG